MRRMLSGFIAFLFALSAFAQASGAEPPVEKASPVTVAIFVVLFIGLCAGYLIYTWWRHGKAAEATKDSKPG